MEPMSAEDIKREDPYYSSADDESSSEASSEPEDLASLLNSWMPTQEMISSWSPATRVRLAPNYTDLVQILVGPSEEPFNIHKDRLCACSRFFAAALSNSVWLETQENLVRLPEIDPHHFRVYAHGVYTNKIDLSVRWKADELSDVHKQQGLMEHYVLAEYLDDFFARTCALADLCEGWAEWTSVPLPAATVPFYEKTAPGSALRAYLVEVTLRLAPEHIAEHIGELPREFLQEFAVAGLDSPFALSKEEFVERLKEKLLPDDEEEDEEEEEEDEEEEDEEEEDED